MQAQSASDHNVLMNALQEIAELDGWGSGGTARKIASDAMRAQYCREARRTAKRG